MAVKALEKIRVSSKSTEFSYLFPIKNKMKNFETITAKKAVIIMITESIKVSLNSYESLLCFLNAFLGSSTVKIDKEISENILATLSAMEKIPTSVNVLVILAMLLERAAHPLVIRSDIPGEIECFSKVDALSIFTPLLVCSLRCDGIKMYKTAQVSMDNENMANNWLKSGEIILKSIRKAAIPLVKAGRVLSKIAWVNISIFWKKILA